MNGAFQPGNGTPHLCGSYGQRGRLPNAHLCCRNLPGVHGLLLPEVRHVFGRHSRWSGEPAQPPHYLIIDFGKPLNIAAILYTARKDLANGHVRDYEIYLADNPQEWGSPAAKGRFRRNADEETIRLSQPVKARYLKLVALSEQSGQPFATVAKLEVEEAK